MYVPGIGPGGRRRRCWETDVGEKRWVSSAWDASDKPLRSGNRFQYADSLHLPRRRAPRTLASQGESRLLPDLLKELIS